MMRVKGALLPTNVPSLKRGSLPKGGVKQKRGFLKNPFSPKKKGGTLSKKSVLWEKTL